MDASSGPWNPASASISSPSLLLPIPAIVFIAVGVYLVLLGLVLLTRRCLLAQGCCTDCSFPCRKQTASETQNCCWSCAEACDFPLPSPAHYLDACCPHASEVSSILNPHGSLSSGYGLGLHFLRSAHLLLSVNPRPGLGPSMPSMLPVV
ncbi:hypothetical protein A6R68_11287 [Neotoma lepida]|uniref:Uncharacterized protein n=1 Tax=Neotoma lepida TaxID=56216 RepID=A0A1A6FVG6_NEOLE|nr:hypothetical protein A6R68_11287 [Neotoma lepida]